MPGANQWVLPAARLQREPSTPRVALWRKPLDSRNREQLEWIADEVVELGGVADEAQRAVEALTERLEEAAA